MAFTVKNYQAVNTRGTTYITKCLQEVETYIAELGYDWFNIPLTAWPSVYQRIGLLSENLVQRYHISIVAFYRCAQEHGAPPYAEVSYSNFTPKLGENLKAGLTGRFVASLDTLFELVYQSQDVFLRRGMYSLQCDALILAMIWMQMTVEDITKLTTNNVSFFTKDNMLLTGKSFSLSDIHHVFIDCSSERRVVASHKEVLSLLYHVYMKAGQMMFATEHRAPYKVTSFTKRLSRIFTQINEASGLNLTARSVRSSGFYYRLYRCWEEAKMPYVYTESTANYLVMLLELPPKTPVSVKQAEFAKFLEYVREIQDKPV